MLNPGTVHGPELILKRVWESDKDVSGDALYACIKRLRKKIDVQGKDSVIRTVHRVGYEFVS